MYLLLVLSAFGQDPCPVDTDCDGDAYTPNQGDCDETNPDVNPGVSEECTNEIDDNCDGLFNEGCDRAPQQGQLRGGSACAEQEPAAAFLFLPLLLWRRRRR